MQSLTHNIGLMNSGERHSYKFLVKPEDWDDCKDIEAVFYTDSGIIRESVSKSSEDESEDEPEDWSDEDEPEGVGSSSGGCDAGLSALGLEVILSAFLTRCKVR